MVRIRQMNLDDFYVIENILISNFDSFWTPSIFKKELENDNSFYLVAIYKEEIVGFAGYMRILDEADITNIVVRKDMRNKGIATKLFENLLNYINNEKDIKSVTLEVNENNKYAIQLYTKFGFKNIGLRKNYYKNHQNAIIMKLGK